MGFGILNMNTVRVVGITKKYTNYDNETIVLNNISLEIKKGEFVAIVGASGSGKTTLLNLMGGLDCPTKGMVYINDIPISDMKEEELSIFRRENIGFVFQNYNLIPSLSVLENIILPLKLDGRNVETKFVDEIADDLKIKKNLRQMPNTLSGGQQQRVAIARALITKPAIVLADEPTGNLDSQGSREVVALIKDMSAQYDQTVVLVTHNEEIALQSDRIIRIEDGKIIE